ncbi:transcriptional repressor LexA [Phosphitispora fastidiosa]|uniref:transcriptional repressor LexA n=1 Tax=Phosphitispora fastidiosa TaxID=2837202 RepID=UPI001E322F14|nr:repressor LexA [Phosphitispora fastidiosa]
MYSDISERQISILNFIKKELQKRGYPPSVREIGVAVGLSSSSTVHGHLAQLEKKGYIRRDPTKPRAIEVIEGEGNFVRKEIVNVPIVGRVTAGEPILAVENIEDTFPLPIEFVNNDNVFILSVRGESMINAGILDGDYVVVRQQSVARNGEIVVALLEDEATVKTFYKEKDYIRLQPENPYMDPIYATDVKILGKVTGVFRRIQ